MNLFCMDDILSYGEVKAVSDDGKNPGYNNYLLVMDYNRSKYRSQSYLYFISFDYNKKELIPVKAKELAGQYMKECPQASDFLKRIVGNPGSKTLRNFLAINFFTALFTALIIPNEFNQAIGGLNNKTNYAYIYLSVSGGVYFTYSLLHKKRIVKRENMQQAVKMYNACVK